MKAISHNATFSCLTLVDFEEISVTGLMVAERIVLK